MKKDKSKTKGQLIPESSPSPRVAPEMNSLEDGMEEALIRSEEKFRGLAEQSPNMVFINQAGRIVYANHQCEEIMGYGRDEFYAPGFDFMTLVAPECIQQARASFVRHMESEEIPPYDCSLVTKYGRRVDVILTTRLIDYDEGKAILGIMTDITERRRMEKSLQESESLYRSLFDNMLNGFAYCKMIFEQDKPADFIYLNVNKSFETLTGLKDVMGKRVSEVIPGIQKSDPELFEIYSRVALTGIPEMFETHVRALEMWFSVSVYSPEKEYFVAVFDVITERKKAEESLQESEEMLRSVFEVGPLGMALSSPDYRFIKVNQRFCKMLGYSEEELTSLTFADITHPDYIGRDSEAVAKLFQGEIPVYQTEKRYLRKDKDSFWGNLTCSVIRDKEGKSLYFLAAVEDITERKKADEKLTIAEQNFRNSLDESPLGIRIVTEEGRLLYANKAILDIFGYSSINELETTPAQARYTPESYAVHEQRIVLRRQGIPVPSNYEISIVRKDGEIRHLSVLRKEVMWNNERQFQAVYQDITERRRAEETLRLQAELLNLESDSVDLHDFDGNFLYVNKAAYLTLGYTREELLNMKLSQLEDKEYNEQTPRRLKELTEKGTITFNVNHRHKNGSSIPLEVHAALIEIGARKLVISVAHDITERKTMEEELRLKAQLLDAATDLIHVTDLDGKLLYVNEASCLNLGYSREELLGHYMPEFITSNSFQRPHPRDLVASERSAIVVEAVHVRKDKTLLPVEVHYSVIDWGGRKVFLDIVRDITERKTIEAKVEQAAKEWSATFDSITDMISIHDKDFRIVRMNKAFAESFKMPPEALIGKHCYEVVHGTSAPIASCPLARTLTTGRTEVAEIFEPLLEIWLQVTTSPMFDEKGEITGAVHTSRDITQSRKIQEKLMAQDRLASIGLLVSGVAHEINNPLTGIIGFSDLLLQKNLPDDTKAELQVINDEAQRTARIVRNLLTFARKQPEGKLTVNLNVQIERVLSLRHHEQEMNNIQSNLDFAPDLPQVTGNASQLQQVFFNIVVNAEQAMFGAHNKGFLTITTERVGDNVRVSFADDGPGITPENMNRLFTPFFTTKEVGKGTGLGLSICHGIITEHGGKIYAESGPGKGATFILELPVGKPE